MTGARRQSIDVYRGLALLAMAAYHACWDLAYYRLIDAGIGVDPVWLTAQRSILSAFLLLAGASLALAHREGIRWSSFWRREAILVAAALAVTAGTWVVFGADYVAYFGVLHAIALFSLLALPLVVAPLWIGATIAAVVLLLPAVYSSAAFDPRWLNWIGFFTDIPESADLVPVFPWFGVVVIGVLGMRLAADAPAFTWSSRLWPVRALAWLGRWSLLFYLIHQPILFGIITPIANAINAAESAKIAAFTQSCTASCGATHDAPFCTAYCGCALDMVVRDNLWNAVNAKERTQDQQSSVDAMTGLCTAMAK